MFSANTFPTDPARTASAHAAVLDARHPYGKFTLDMDSQLDLDPPATAIDA